MFLTGSGPEPKKEKGDPRTDEQKAENMLRELTNVVNLLKQIHKHELRLEKMDRWLSANNPDGYISKIWEDRHAKWRYGNDRELELIGNLQTVSARLELAIKDLSDTDRVKHMKAWSVPWPCTFTVGRYSQRLAETPWRDYCPF